MKASIRRLSNGLKVNMTLVTYEEQLDTVHGADYFRLWHRDKKNSGGMLSRCGGG